MNGNVNGIVDEPMETDSPSTTVDNVKKVIPDEVQSNHCENSNNTENSNHTDSESNQEPTVDSGQHNGDSANEETDDHSIQQSDTVDPLSKTNSDRIIENNLSNSNESSAKSESNSQNNLNTNVVLSKKSNNGADENDGDIRMETEFVSTVNCGDSEDEIDSEEDSSDDEDGSEESTQPRAEDTVSINSDSETEGAGQRNKNNSDVILVENDNGIDSQNGRSPEVHEILSDNDDTDCVVTNETTVKKKQDITPRRSTRSTISRKKYVDEDLENGDDDDESDIEEIEPVNPLSRKSKPIVIKDTKDLVHMAAKGKPGQKEPTVVIIDTKSKNKNTSNNAASLYQNIESRGTTVTPISVKQSNQNIIQNTPPPPILPSLTDDMFVVEAPSFIVPYVYEKPSIMPFRESVDILGKELEDLMAKELAERLELEKAEKERKQKEKQEKKDRGEEVEDSDEEKKAEVPDTDEEKKKKKEEKKERRQRRAEEDDASWDGESSSSSEEDETLSDDDKISTVVIKDKVDDTIITDIKQVTELSAEKIVTKSDNYFDCSLGKYFINIGLNLVQGYVQNDLLKQQNRKLQREKKAGNSTKATLTAIASLSKNIEFSKAINAPYTYSLNKCELCSFKTESSLVMAHHLETPHMKNNIYRCNFCTFEIKSPHDILCHMDKEHKVRGKLERAPALHQCANCPFEDSGKGKLARHLIPCAKKFKPDINLGPPVEWEPPAKIPKITRSRNNLPPSSYHNAFARAVNNMNRPMNMNVMNMMAFRPTLKSTPRPVHTASNVRPTGVLIKPNNNPIGQIIAPSNFPVANNGKKPGHQPSLSITPIPRQHPPQPQPVASQQNKGSFVICEICDGYIKDLEQLRNHMQWIHKVKIHPKMIYNRPPLNCQKCQFRFFTDQGLERHLLGSHGLVTSSMQEAANKGKDAGRCPVCGRVYQWKLLNHVGKDHNLTLKPAHLSYKCTVCMATFGMYKQFENHVYSAHSTVAKRVMDKNKGGPTPPTAKTNASLLKPLKINDEITIIPQLIKDGMSTSKGK